MKKIFFSLFVLQNIIGLAQLKAEDVKTFTLKNGMKFLVVEDFTIPNANMYLFYKVGSRNEHEGVTGISHFFEHMMYNGAQKYGPKMFDRTMEFNGGSNNAYTTSNVTVYSNWFPVSSAEIIFELEGDRISSLSIDSTMIESERGVVLSERSNNLENSPWTLLSDVVQEAAFLEHPYHWPVIGYEDDIKNWKQQDLEKYFKTYYAPNNCVVVITGAIKFEKVKLLAEKYLETIPSQALPPIVHIKEPLQNGERRITVQKEVSTPYLMIAYHTVDVKNEDYYALNMLSYILSSGESSRLYSVLVDQKQLATDISTSFADNLDPGLFNIYAIANPEVDVLELEKEIYIQIDKIIKEGMSENELQKIKNQILIQFYRQTETINGKSDNLGTFEVFFGDYKKMFDAPKKYNKITSADIQAVAKKYFKKSNRTVGILETNVED